MSSEAQLFLRDDRLSTAYMSTAYKIIVVSAVVLASQSVAYSLSKEELNLVWAEKMPLLATFTYQSVVHDRFFKPTGINEYTKVYRFHRLGQMSLKEMYRTDERGEIGSLILKQAFDGELARSLSPSVGREPSTGTIATARVEHIVGVSDGSLFGYSGIYPIGWDGNSGTKLSGAAQCDLTVLLQLPACKLLPETEEVDGRECYVLTLGDPVHSKWWLGQDLGFACVRREGYEKAEDGSPFLRIEIDFRDHLEVEPSLYIPTSMTVRSWEMRGGERVQAHQSDVTLVSLDLAPNLSSDDFEVTFPKGTIVKDEILRTTYTIHDSRDPLLSEIEATIADLSAATRTTDQTSAETRPDPTTAESKSPELTDLDSYGTSSRSKWALAAGILLAGSVAVFLVHKSLRRNP